VALIAAVTVSLLLIGWFAASVSAQVFQGVHDRLWFVSRFGLIPSWRFFAPRPAMDDTHLLYRDRFRTQVIGPPHCVSTIEDRRWHHLFWNPQKFHNKVFTDLCQSMRRHLRQINQDSVDSRVIVLSTPYLVLLNLVMRMPRPPDVEARQFILVTEKSFAEDPDRKIVFVGEFHRFEARR
jgi:hypothetical protein